MDILLSKLVSLFTFKCNQTLASVITGSFLRSMPYKGAKSAVLKVSSGSRFASRLAGKRSRATNDSSISAAIQDLSGEAISLNEGEDPDGGGEEKEPRNGRLKIRPGLRGREGGREGGRRDKRPF